MATHSNQSIGWRMVAIAFLLQNCAIGMAVGSYSTAMPAIEQELGSNRALTSAAVGIMLLSLGLLSPLVGTMLRRVSIRTAMTLGVALNIVGYVTIAYATSLYQILAVYGLLIGPGACLLGPLTVSTLVSRWFDAGRGKALGIANMPLFLLVAPPVAAILVTHGGRNLLFLVMAGIFVALLPIVRLIRDHPPSEAAPAAATDDAAKPAVAQDDGIGVGGLLRDPQFWLLSFVIGVVTAAGTAFVTHSVPLATSKGIDLALASTLVSMFGAGTLAGAIVFGWLIDKAGPVPSLLVNTGTQVLLWMLLVSMTTYPGLLILAGMIGLCSGGVVAMHSSALVDMYGQKSFSRAMGFSYFLKVPFLFGAAPVVGHVFDETGAYYGALLGMGAILAVAVVVSLIMMVSGRRLARKSLAS